MRSRDLWWTTDRDLATDPVRQWAEVATREIGEMDITSTVGAEFTAQWRRLGLGPIDLNCLCAAPLRVVRSKAMVDRSAVPGYNLLYVCKGLAHVAHCGRHFEVNGGSFVMLDSRAPCDLSYPAPAQVLSIYFPDKWLRRWVAHPQQMVASSITGDASWGRPLAALLTAIAEEGLDAAGLPRSAIAEQCGALVALLTGRGSALVTRHSDELLHRLKRIMQDRFQDATLTPGEVASAAGISKRHLHGLFAEAGSTFVATLFALRLDNARRLLSSAHHRGYTVGDIADECGFSDPSHFARRFRARYGAAPVSYRRQVLPRSFTSQ